MELAGPILLLLSACAEPAKPNECNFGMVTLSPGYCGYPDTTAPPGTTVTSDSGTTVGTDDTGITDDTGSTTPTIPLDGECVAPDVLPDDPIVIGWQTDLIGVPGAGLVELVDVEVGDGVVYSVGQGGLLVVDTSSGTPEPQSVYAGDGRYHRVEALEWPYVAATHREIGLAIVDVTDMRSVELVSRTQMYGWEGIAADGDLLYVAARHEGLVVLDVSRPDLPTVVSETPGLESTWEIVGPIDGYLYAADGSLGVVPIDVSDPEAPVFGVPVPVPGLQHLALDGDWLYGAAGSTGLVVFDRSDPAAPVWVTSVATGGSAVTVAADAGLVHIADHESLSSFDVTDPRAPVPVGREPATQFALGVAAEGTSAWVGDWGYFERFDVSNSTGAGELDVRESAVQVDEAGVGELTITNRGAGDLTIYSASSDDSTLSFVVGTPVLAAGETTTLQVNAPAGTTLDTALCLATDDPDSPVFQVPVRTGHLDSYIGQVAPDFVLNDLEGNSWQLSELLGHPVVLVYFATW